MHTASSDGSHAAPGVKPFRFLTYAAISDHDEKNRLWCIASGFSLTAKESSAFQNASPKADRPRIDLSQRSPGFPREVASTWIDEWAELHDALLGFKGAAPNHTKPTSGSGRSGIAVLRFRILSPEE